jgi:hypothetical protein
VGNPGLATHSTSTTPFLRHVVVYSVWPTSIQLGCRIFSLDQACSAQTSVGGKEQGLYSWVGHPGVSRSSSNSESFILFPRTIHMYSSRMDPPEDVIAEGQRLRQGRCHGEKSLGHTLAMTCPRGSIRPAAPFSNGRYLALEEEQRGCCVTENLVGG